MKDKIKELINTLIDEQDYYTEELIKACKEKDMTKIMESNIEVEKRKFAIKQLYKLIGIGE